MSNSTSLGLLGRLASNGSNADWERLHDIYKPFVYRWLSAYPRLSASKDDIVQEVMLVLTRELPKFERRRDGAFRSFLRQITINQLRKVARQTRKEIAISQGALNWFQSMEALADPVSSMSEKWDRDYEHTVLSRLMETVRGEFSGQHWRAFEMQAIEGQRARIVAEELQLSVNAALLAKSRVLKRLREEAVDLL